MSVLREHLRASWLLWAMLATFAVVASHGVLHAEDPGWFSWNADATARRVTVISQLVTGSAGVVPADPSSQEPLLVDHAIALLARAGLSMAAAFALVSIATMIAGLALVYAALVGRVGQRGAALASTVFAFHGILFDATAAGAAPLVGLALVGWWRLRDRRGIGLACIALAIALGPAVHLPTTVANLAGLAVCALARASTNRSPRHALLAAAAAAAAVVAVVGGVAIGRAAPWCAAVLALWLVALAGPWLVADARRSIATWVAMMALLGGVVRTARMIDHHELVAPAWEVDQARALRHALPRGAVILTSGESRHLVPMLTGFATVPHADRRTEQSRAKIFAATRDADLAARDLAITHIFVGPDEQRRLLVRPDRLRARFRVVYRAEGVEVFALR